MKETKRGRPIDPERIKKAKVALVAAEGNVNQAARLAGCQPRTIQSYIDKGLIDPTVKADGKEFLARVEELTQGRKDELANNLFVLAEKATQQAINALPDATAQQAATVMGIAIEKSNLLRGEATQKVDLNISTDLEVLRRHG